MRSIEHIQDFPDKLNPMLVKELRQGLRGISFVILFIAVQAFLCFILLVTAAVASHENAGHLLSRIIFFFFSLAVVVVQPLRGISALHGEIKGQTIDLLCLTRLSAWRITYGKWISIVGQSALILTAIIPYLILRYFFGDMKMFSEILLLLSVFLVSAMLTAFTVGISAMSSAITRVLLPIASAFMLFIATWGIFLTSGREGFQFFIEFVTLDSAQATFTFLGFVIACVYISWMCLDMGTSQIAPIAENRATVRRLVSLGLILLSLLAFGLAGVDPDIAVVIGLALSIPVGVISLTEDPYLVQPIVSPFARKGLLGKALGRLLYPGWATGLIFVLILYGVLHTMMSHFLYQATVGPIEAFIAVTSIFAIIIFPLALTRLCARKHENRFGLFVLFVCTQFLIVGIIYAAESWTRDLKLMQYFCWVPTSFIYLDNSHGFSDTAKLNLSFVNLSLYSILALSTSIPTWKHIHSVERATVPPKS